MNNLVIKEALLVNVVSRDDPWLPNAVHKTVVFPIEVDTNDVRSMEEMLRDAFLAWNNKHDDKWAAKSYEWLGDIELCDVELSKEFKDDIINEYIINKEHDDLSMSEVLRLEFINGDKENKENE